jgi:hypothetical protein
LSHIHNAQIVWNHIENEHHYDCENRLAILNPLFIILPIQFSIEVAIVDEAKTIVSVDGLREDQTNSIE